MNERQMLKQPAPRLASIDLNLLVVYDAIMRDRSVTKAGNRLGLSQPAMSHALARLRHMLKDDLFVRSPSGMQPTPRAEQLATPIRFALDALQQALEPDHFEPSESEATFSVAVDNNAAVVLVPKIVAAISAAAPHVKLDFRPSGTIDVTDFLDRSELHLAIGAAELTGERFSHRTVTEDKFVLTLRRGHPAAKFREISAEILSSLSLLEISSAKFDTDAAHSEPRPRLSKRTPDVRAPFLSAAHILRHSELVAILPLNVAKTLVDSHGLCYRPLSRSPRAVRTSMTWLRRLDNHPAHAWLRDAILQAARN